MLRIASATPRLSATEMLQWNQALLRMLRMLRMCRVAAPTMASTFRRFFDGKCRPTADPRWGRRATAWTICNDDDPHPPLAPSMNGLGRHGTGMLAKVPIAVGFRNRCQGEL